jgi:orotate phosphoribosyltransferase
MAEAELLEELRRVGALREGHFLLTSGQHSPVFLLLARVFEHPELGGEIGRRLAGLFRDEGVEAVVGPAMGGVILAYEVARHLPGTRALFAEKTPDGGMGLRRGFQIGEGERVLVVEDVLTTGGSVRKVLDHLAGRAELVGVGTVVDRSGGKTTFGTIPLRSLLRLDLPQYLPEGCPECRRQMPLERPKA